MSPSIKIDAEVFTALQELAEPLIDTPNSVLRRLLGLDARNGSDGTRRPSASGAALTEEGPGMQEGSSVGRMREGALAAIGNAFLEHDLDGALLQAPRDGAPRRGPRDQRYVSPRGQSIYLRTRSYDAHKPPFFTMQPDALAEADWFVFVCEDRGSVVMPGSVLRELRSGLHRDAGGDFKPTFVLDDNRCELYVAGELTSVERWRDAFAEIAQAESRLPE